MTASDCPVDVETLDTLRELADEDTPDFFTDLVESYIADATRLGRELQEALAAEDVERVARTTHTMKSSSANIGAGKLAGLCASIESEARSKNSLVGAKEKASQVAEELKAVVAYLSTQI